MSIYENIKTLCDMRGISTYTLEKALGFSHGSLVKLKDAKTINATRLNAIAEYFGVAPEYILTGETTNKWGRYYLDPETAEIAQKIFEDPALRGLFHIAKNLSPKTLKAHYELMKLMYEKEQPDD